MPGPAPTVDLEALRDRLARRAAPAVGALTATVIAAQLGREDVDGVAWVDETAAVLLGKLTAMPTYLGVGMLSAALLFDEGARAAGGRRFRELDHRARLAWLDRWRGAPVGVLRDFVAFFEKMGVFVYYSHVEENELEDGAHP